MRHVRSLRYLLFASVFSTALSAAPPVHAQSAFAASRPEPPQPPLRAAYPDAPLPQAKEAGGVYMVNGAPYHAPTGAERLHQYTNDVVGPERFGLTVVSAAYSFGRGDPPEWSNGATGFGKHVGSTYGQSFVSSSVKAGVSAALHEDTHYIVCHGCTVKQRLHNSVMSEFTARRGADGHTAWSLTPTLANYAGPLVSHTVWYPNEYGVRDAAVSGTEGYATHIGFRFAREMWDMYKTQKQQNRGN